MLRHDWFVFLLKYTEDLISYANDILQSLDYHSKKKQSNMRNDFACETRFHHSSIIPVDKYERLI